MLNRVTITGADDKTRLADIVELSEEFPFVEWGILVSLRQEGGFRFPSRDWIDRFSAVALVEDLNVSTHVCGKWVRQMFTGALNWADLPNVLWVSRRVQINTHAETHVSTTGLMTALMAQPCKEFIFQWDGINDHLTFAAHGCGLNVAALFDTSGGAGVLPSKWPVAAQQFPCGYAGGLGPDNVVEQVQKIAAVCQKPFWIDMERRVRTEDDSRLDMNKVRRVLELCATGVAA